MPDLDLGNSVSNDECDAIASHARNRLRSDRHDPSQDSRRHFRCVARAATIKRLAGGPKAAARSRPAADDLATGGSWTQQ
jgi:hypothetical protein